MASSMTYVVLLGLCCVLYVQGCRPGWKRSGNKCYLFKSEQNSQSAAKATCKFLGGYLAEPRSAAENKAISSVIKGFIGYTDAAKEGVFLGVHTKKVMGYKNWNQGEPNNVGANGEDCVEIFTSGKWNDVPCGVKRGFICEYQFACPNGWNLHNQNCYKFVTSKKTKHNAQTDCKNQGGYLAEIGTEKENSFVRSKLKVQSFIGFNDVQKEGTFVSDSSGKAITYKKWNRGEPNNVGKNGEDCVEIFTSGKWNDVPCGNSRAYVCEKKAC